MRNLVPRVSFPVRSNKFISLIIVSSYVVDYVKIFYVNHNALKRVDVREKCGGIGL